MRVERGHRHHSGPCTSGATAAGIEASPALQATADGRECADTHLELRCQRREHAARKRKSSHELQATPRRAFRDEGCMCTKLCIGTQTEILTVCIRTGLVVHESLVHDNNV